MCHGWIEPFCNRLYLIPVYSKQKMTKCKGCLYINDVSYNNLIYFIHPFSYFLVNSVFLMLFLLFCCICMCVVKKKSKNYYYFK